MIFLASLEVYSNTRSPQQRQNPTNMNLIHFFLGDYKLAQLPIVTLLSPFPLQSFFTSFLSS